ncbi:alpha/beta fold hydrolase [Anaeromyxobacter sp. Fw109-5]|uniref:alpha/beta fold hydrolase n=1 Tax=Anaeromyxobacter sp. (strain Fw109-5) TaxID=404589 RepID=UPI0000ED7D5C|nr:alpha/beta hydrolase [Anaeromyxobacter sp. Fw109-5]ABS25796.1 alpha/beta hydrolase fold [Anaeromyxobacter sp. Fw109-5]
MRIEVDGVGLFHTVRGEGEPVVLVHGSWGDHHDWDIVVPALAQRRAMIAYDRRGHSLSGGRPATVHEHVADLAALVDGLGLGPVHLVAHSYGASIALRTAALHPGRIRSLAAHEPPLMWTLDGPGPHAPALQAFRVSCARTEAALREGRMRDAARTFVDEIGLGPGAWERLARSARETFVRNAPTFLAEIEDPDALALDLPALRAFRGPVLLTQGDQSPPLYGPILDRVAAALPQATRHTFAGAGHVPQVSHPRDFVRRIEAFLAGA